MKHLILLLTFVCTLAAHAQIDISQRTLAYDHLRDRYLCSVPESMFNDGSVEDFRCDTARIDFTFLPIVRLNGTFGYDYANGTIDVIMPDMTSQEHLLAKVKWRGGTSNSEDKHKRNYHLKFIGEDGKKKDVKFFGLRKDNNWMLDAAQNDMSRIRNRAATDIWNEFATKPYYYDKEPKALTGTRGQFVEVFLNNEYIGIYTMTENMDRAQMKLKKYTENEDGTKTIHGQLWKGKSWMYSGLWNYDPYDNYSDVWGGLEMKYPDIEDVCPTDWSTFYYAARFMTDSDPEQVGEFVDSFFDMPVLTDYYLLMTLMCAIDNTGGKNIFWACYDTKTDKKLTVGVWDLDCSAGESWDPYDYREWRVAPDNINHDYFWGIKPIYVLDSLNINDFRTVRETRWKSLRQTYFTEENITQHYTKYMDMLTKAGAYRREKERWDGDSDIGNKTFDFEEERQYICDWFHKRLKVLDANFPTCETGINQLQTDPPSARNAVMYNLQGQRVGSVARPGIYIRNGRKFMQR